MSKRSLMIITSLLLLSGVIKANLSYGFNDHKQNTIIAQSSASTDSTLLISQKKVTVRIITEGNSGSGVIIGKRNNTYLILTALHVIQARQNIQVQTDDGELHSAKAIPNSLAKDKDLALLEFTTNKTYAIAKIAKQISLGSGLDTGIELSATGYPSQSKEFSSIEVTIQQLPKASLKEGYQLPYSGEIAQGMSGGPVFLDDELVAINGRTAFPIFNNYDYEDGSKPSKNEIEQMRKANWGIPINTALAYVKPEILTSYGLPLPAANTAIATAPLQGWLATLEAKAKGFTVRIDSSSETNGSGVIIAKDGNTYTVLTAAHVVCQKTSTNQNCANLSYQILAPDGKRYQVNPNSIIQEEGVDLAVVKFQSEQKYDVATLVNYNPNESDFVFVAGFPKIKGQNNSQWLFSGGKVLEKQQGLASIRQGSSDYLKIAEVVGVDNKTVKSINPITGDYELVNTGITDIGISVSSGEANTLTTGGYELVYTSITYGGMSGGPVLDSAGRVIGIHGQAEGANVLIHEGSSLVSNAVQLGYSLGIPTSTLMNLSERLKLKLSLSDNKAPALSQQQITDINKSILRVEVPKTNAPAEVWLEKGNQLWRLGKYQEADKAFDKAIEQNNPQVTYLAWYGKGVALANNKQYQQSITALDQALKTLPSPSSANYSNELHSSIFTNQYLAYTNLSNFPKALEVLDRAIELSADNQHYDGESLIKKYKFYINRAFIYCLVLRQYPQALADLNKAIELDPKLAQAYGLRGLLHMISNQYPQALADYNKAIELDPKYAPAYLNRGLVYQKSKQYPQALADYSKAIELDPKFANAYYNRGWIYQDSKQYPQALADYSKAIELDPKFAKAYYNRGVLYQDSKQYPQALADYSKAIELDPKYANAYFNRGLIYQDSKQYPQALADFNKAIELNPKYADAYSGRGQAHYMLGQYPQALADYSKAIELNSKDAIAYFNRGFLYRKSKQYPQALADFNKAIELNPKYAPAYLERAQTHYMLGQYPQALADYSKAIESDSKYADAYLLRGSLYTILKQYPQAIIDLKTAAELFNQQGNTEQYNNAMSILKELGQ